MATPNESVSNAGYYELVSVYPVATIRAGAAARAFMCFVDGAITVKRVGGGVVSLPASGKANVRYPCQIESIDAAPGECLVFY